MLALSVWPDESPLQKPWFNPLKSASILKQFDPLPHRYSRLKTIGGRAEFFSSAPMQFHPELCRLTRSLSISIRL